MKIDINNYKNIIFDLGGVILNIDYNLTVKAFAQLTTSNFDSLFSKAKQTNLFDLFEKGEITPVEFRKKLRSQLNCELADEAVDDCWNALLLDLPIERLHLLQKLASKHRIFLLSNTNEIHINRFNIYLKERFNVADLSTYFEKVYLSYEVGMRKPDEEIFYKVLNDNNLKPEETLFIDDSEQHIQAAKKIGINTYLLDVKEESILDLF
ncbi:MAG: HAD family phosphatase [Bacteroidia bacterium]